MSVEKELLLSETQLNNVQTVQSGLLQMYFSCKRRIRIQIDANLIDYVQNETEDFGFVVGVHLQHNMEAGRNVLRWSDAIAGWEMRWIRHVVADKVMENSEAFLGNGPFLGGIFVVEMVETEENRVDDES